MDAITEARLASLHPVFISRFRQLNQRILESPLAVHLRITQGLRSWSQQDALYAQGRTIPDTNIVTEARGGYSAHNFGYACDGVPDLPGLQAWQPDWNHTDARWSIFLTTALECGFAEGTQWRTFPDAPHIYLPELPATPDDNMRYLYKEGGLAAVWQDWEGKF